MELFKVGGCVRDELLRKMKVSIPKKINFHRDWCSPDYNPTARKFMGIQFGQKEAKKQRNYDSRRCLEQFGFIVLGEDNYFHHSYECILPEGWTVEEDGYTTKYFNPEGEMKISQFDKYCSYDSDHFVDFF